MDYQIWIKDQYGELWSRKDAGDLDASSQYKRANLRRACRSQTYPLAVVARSGRIGNIIADCIKGLLRCVKAAKT